MNITIIGCGNAGTTVGADLSLKGHNVTLLKTSKALHNDHFDKIYKDSVISIEENGITRFTKVNVTTDARTALENSELVILYIQTNYHEQVIKQFADYFQDGQVVLIEPGYLSTCYFLKYVNKDITIVEAESSPIDCRIVSPGQVRVLFKNTLNPVGVFPKHKKEYAKDCLSKLEYPFEYLDSVVEAALHNPNLIVHTVGAIFSVPRIEYVQKNGGTYSMYREVFTPHIWNLVQSLDKEKMDVLEAVGCSRLPYVEACKHRNSTDDRDATEVFFDYAYNSSPDGPCVPNSRYITEDVPEGLVMLESLGKHLHIKTPICTSLIELSSSILNLDFRFTGRSVEKLEKENIEKILK